MCPENRCIMYRYIYNSCYELYCIFWIVSLTLCCFACNIRHKSYMCQAHIAWVFDNLILDCISHKFLSFIINPYEICMFVIMPTSLKVIQGGI